MFYSGCRWPANCHAWSAAGTSAASVARWSGRQLAQPAAVPADVPATRQGPCWPQPATAHTGVCAQLAGHRSIRLDQGAGREPTARCRGGPQQWRGRSATHSGTTAEHHSNPVLRTQSQHQRSGIIFFLNVGCDFHLVLK